MEPMADQTKMHGETELEKRGLRLTVFLTSLLRRPPTEGKGSVSWTEAWELARPLVC